MRVLTEKISDQASFNRRWRPALMSFFLRRVRDHAEAEDLTQDVFSRLLGNSETDMQAADGYIFQVAANLLTDRARRARVRAAYRDEIIRSEGQGIEPLDPYRIAVSRAALSTFTRSLEELPDRTRIIFTLYRIENMSLDRIAESFGISKSAVKKQVAKAMALLMARMRDSR